MKIRVMGTKTECTEVVPVLREAFEVHEVSGFYANRGESTLGRVYVEAAIKPTGVVRFDAARHSHQEGA